MDFFILVVAYVGVIRGGELINKWSFAACHRKGGGLPNLFAQ